MLRPIVADRKLIQEFSKIINRFLMSGQRNIA